MVVYVDDLLVTGTSIKQILEFKREMATKFELSDLGKLTYYLGIEVLQCQEGIALNQERYNNIYAVKPLKPMKLKSQSDPSIRCQEIIL